MADEQTRDAPPFASRYGLVRPLQGRYLAGVCAALGRATGTDPVLWRVVLAVLVCFLGIGAVIYLVAWLLIPEEGDTASPVEAMLGSGHSSTSPVLAVLLGIAAVFLLVLILPRPLYLLLAGVAVLAGLVLISRARADGRPPGGPTAPPSPVAPAAAATPAAAPGPATAAAAAEPAAPGAPAAAATAPAGPAWAPAGPAGTGYRPPFSPHGPFGGPPPPPPPPPFRPPPPPRERSALPAAIFFAILLTLGSLGILDLASVLSVPASGYLAGALAVVGAGLLAGAWVGRARPLIALGAVLALALPVAHALEAVGPPEHTGDVRWEPRAWAELEDEYALTFGSGVVDLREVDFGGRETEITIRITLGEIRVELPEEVAVEATVHSQFGSATVFGESHGGLVSGQVTDPGSGDPADGVLRLDLYVRFGDLAVHR